MAGSDHFQFKGAGAGPGLEIWRIEAMAPVPWPKSQYGQFHEGDSYIILKTNGREMSSSLDWDLHFWLGKDTTHDEKGVAAYKTVELDDSLGGTPVQHRETQEHESPLFLSYFKQGIEYLPGGVDSGFTQVEEAEFKTRLLHLKGSHRIRAKQVEPSCRSLNSGDVFLLDTGKVLFQWNGKDSSRKEKAAALEMSTKIKNERGSSTVVVLCEEGAEVFEFWEAMPGGKGSIKAADDPSLQDDRTAEASAKEDIKLYRVTDSVGRLEMNLEGGYPLKKEMLDTNDCFIVSTGSSLFCWIGKRATKEEKKNAMLFAQDFLVQQDMPDWTPVERVLEGGETQDFKLIFDHFDPPQKPQDFGKPAPVGGRGVARVQQKAVDVGSLHRQASRDEAMAGVLEVAKSNVEVWRIENFEKVPWPKELYGQFFGGDSFLVLYTYVPKGRTTEEYLLYIWQGRESSQDEKGASALLAVALDDEYGGRPVQVRVEQGKEPDHMVAIFNGKMVVHKGGKASGFKNKTAEDTYDTDGVSLFHVRGTSPANTRAVQVEEVSAQLNSGDAFILLTPGKMFVWYGTHSSEDERRTAKATAYNMLQDRDMVEVEEGREPADFWAPLGGKQKYASFSPSEAPKPPRLFQCSDAGGAFRVDEIVDFQQDDLDVDDIFVLDCYTEVYVWVGNGANESEKQMASETARKYVESAPDGRDPQCAITTVAQGSEPLLFTCHFLGWDPVAAAAFEDPYEAKMAQLGQQAAAFSRPSPSASELIEKLNLQGVAPESEVQAMIVNFEYYDVDGGGFMDQEEFRKLAPTLIEEGLVRKGAERAADLADAFSAVDRDGSGYIDLEEFIEWWFRDKLASKAKMEAKSKPKLSERDVSDIKERLAIRSVPEAKILEMKAAFEKYDSDGSGMLSNDEFRRIAPEMGVNLTPNGLRKAFEHLDADGSGTVEFEEFLKWHFADKVESVLSIEEKIKLEKAKAQAQAAKAADKTGEMGNVMDHARSVFKKYDKDRSGTISPDEFAELCYDMGKTFDDAEERKLVVSLLDSDGDGEVSFKEFFRWWKSHKDKFFVSSYSEDVKAAIYYFKKFDADLSGKLDRTEYAAMCTEMGWDTRDIDASMKYLDTDGDGEISFNEFLTWYTDDGMVNNLIKTYDRDGNGKLNLEEFTEMCRQWSLDPAKASLILKKFDKDKDGELGLEDMKALMKKIKK